MKATVERLRLGIALGVVMIAGAVRAAPAVNLICDGNGVRDTMDSRRHNQVDESRFPIASYTIRLDFDRGTVTVDTPFGVWPYVEYGRVDAPITHLEAAELKFDWLLPEERRNVYPAEIDARLMVLLIASARMVALSFIWKDYHLKDERVSVWREADYKLKCVPTTTEF